MPEKFLRSAAALLLWVGTAVFAAAAAEPEPPAPPATFVVDDAVMEMTLGENAAVDFAFTVVNEAEEALIPLFGGAAALEDGGEFQCRAPGFFSRAPAADIITTADGPVLRIRRPGSVRCRVRFTVRSSGEGSRRMAELKFPALRGSVRSFLKGPGADAELRGSLADGDARAWQLGDAVITWRFLDGGSAGGEEAVLRLAGKCELAAVADTLRFIMRADGELSSGSVGESRWHLPSGWTPARVEADPELRNWSFDPGTSMLTAEFADKVSGGYRITVELSRPVTSLPCDFTISCPEPEAAYFASEWEVYAGDGLSLELRDSGSLVRVAGPEPIRIMKSGGPRQYFAVCGGREPARFTLRVSEPEISSESMVRVTVAPERFSAKADFKINVRQAPAGKLTVTFPRQWRFQSLISGDGRRPDFVMLPDDGSGIGRGVLEFPEPVAGETEFSLVFEADPVFGREFASGDFRIAGAKGRGHAALICDPAVEAGTVTLQGLTPVPPDTLPVHSNHTIASGISRDEPWSMNCTPVPAPRRISGEIFELYTVGEGRSSGFALFTLDCTGAPFDEMDFEFPAGCGNIEFTGSGNASVSAVREIGGRDGFTARRVTFARRTTGAVTILATFELAGGAGSAFTYGGISILGNADISSCFAAVTGTPVMKPEASEAPDGVTAILPEQLPAEYTAMINGRVLQAWRLAPRARGETVIRSGARVETLPAIIQRADYRCQADADGQCVINGSYLLKNIRSQFLRLRPPPGAVMWRVSVNGAVIQPVTDGSHTLIPLPRPENPDELISVEFVMALALDMEQARTAHEMRLSLPVPDAPIIGRGVSVGLPETLAAGGNGRKSSFSPGFGAWSSPVLRHYVSRCVPVMICAAAAVLAGAAAGIAFALRRRLMGIAAALLCVGGMAAGVLLFSDRVMGDRVELPVEEPRRVLTFESAADFGSAGGEVVFEIASPASPSHFSAWLALTGLAVLAAGFGLLFCRRTRIIGGVAVFAGTLGALWSASLTPIGAVAAGLVIMAFFVLAAPVLAGASLYRLRKVALLLVLTACAGLDADTVFVPGYDMDLEWFDDALAVSGVVEVRADGPCTMRLAGGGGVLFAELEDDLKLRDTGDGWELEIADDGEYRIPIRFLAPATRDAGVRLASFYLPPAVRGTVRCGGTGAGRMRLDGAVSMDENPDGTVTFVMPSAGGEFTARCDDAGSDAEARPGVNIHENVLFAPGAVRRGIVAHIAANHGEVKSITLVPGAEWQVLEVSAPGMDFWRRDGDGAITVNFTRAPRGGFDVSVEAVRVIGDGDIRMDFAPCSAPGCVYSNGIVEFQAGEEKQFGVEPPEGVARVMAGNDKIHRYLLGDNEYLFKLTVGDVAPRVRAAGLVGVNLLDDRTMLECDYRLEVEEGAVFEQRIAIPDGFEPLVVTTGSPSEWHGRDGVIRIIFADPLRRRSENIHCEFVRMGPPAAEMTVPNPALPDASRVTGSLEVTSGKGRTLSVLSRKELALNDTGEENPRSKSFRILSGDWELRVGVSEATPWIAVNQRIQLRLRDSDAEAVFANTVRIENNSVKSLLVKLPEGVKDFEFDGRYISRVTRLDGGLCRIDFSRGIEKEYRLVCRCFYNNSDGIALGALDFPEAGGSISGQLGVTVDDDELKPSVPSGSGISRLDQREFGMLDDRSGLPLEAWNVVGGDWRLFCGTIKNAGAETCRLTVEDVLISGFVGADGVEAVSLSAGRVLNNGAGFLEFRLPDGGLFLGAAVDGVAVTPVEEAGRLLLPLNDGEQQLTIEYVVKHGKPAPGAKLALKAPGFGAPVSGMSWRISVEGDLELKYESGTFREASGLGGFLTGDAYDPKSGGKAPLPVFSGVSTQSGLIAANFRFESAMRQSGDAGARSDIYGLMLRYNSLNNSQNLDVRRRKVSRESCASDGAGADVAEVAERIFSSQQSVINETASFSNNLPEVGRRTIYLHMPLATGAFADAGAVLVWTEALQPPAQLPGVIFSAAVALFVLLLLRGVSRRRRI